MTVGSATKHPHGKGEADGNPQEPVPPSHGAALHKVPPVNHEDLERIVASTIAQRLREYRHGSSLTIAQLAEHSGLSKGMLSKIENSQASPSLTTLAQLASALSVPITAFFRGLEEEHDALHVKSGQGIDIEADGKTEGRRYQLLGATRGAHKGIEPVLVTLDTRTEVFPLFQHPGTEFIFMLSGTMEYGYGTARYILEPGDSLFFEGGVPHGPSNIAQLPVKFLSIKAYDEEI